MRTLTFYHYKGGRDTHTLLRDQSIFLHMKQKRALRTSFSIQSIFLLNTSISSRGANLLALYSALAPHSLTPNFISDYEEGHYVTTPTPQGVLSPKMSQLQRIVRIVRQCDISCYFDPKAPRVVLSSETEETGRGSKGIHQVL